VIDGRPPQHITSLPHRLRLFERIGVDVVLVLDFDAETRGTSAADFARAIFVDALHAEVVVLGFDCRFGRGGEGNFAALERFGRDLGFEARRVDPVELGGVKVSSTEIRRAVLGGDLDRAARILGRPVSVLGTTVRGDARGRELGWPTANLDLHHEVRPPRGVYGVEVEFDGVRRLGLCNIGVRPTFKAAPAADGDSDAWGVRDASESVEVHVLDYAGDLYGKDLEVFFLTKLRDERRFSGKDELLKQLEQDRADFLSRVRP
jgi:riboflavin kinase/FMN adenylyltransferase